MKAIDRNSKVYEVLPMLIKDGKEIASLLPKVVDMLMITRMLECEGISCNKDCAYTLDEQRSALIELLRLSIGSEDIGAFDISMASKAVLHTLYLDESSVYTIFANNNLGDDTMEKQITTGTPIVARGGNKYMAYSYLVTEFTEAMELLEKVDTFNMLENHDEESFDAMIEIMYRALDRRYSKEELLAFVDAEFIQKAIRCYYNLAQVS